MLKDDKLTPKQAAHALGISKRTLTKWEKEGRIPASERDWRGWRWYSQEALLDIRRKMLGGDESEQPSMTIPGMELSARNRLEGIVKEIVCDSIMCEVTLRLNSNNEITALISAKSVRRMRLRVGDKASAIVKATDVMIAR
jgi:molybdopterin-binding protein